MIDRLKTIFITRRKRYESYLNPIKESPQTLFIILCQPRSGSNLLHTYLNSHPSVYSYGEVIRKSIENNKINNNNPSIYKLAFKPHPKTIKAVGVKLFYNYHDIPVYKDCFLEVVDNPAIKIIHLERENLLDTFISLKKAELTNTWSTTKSSTHHSRPHITSTDFKQYLKRVSAQKSNMEKLFKEHHQLHITYEKLFTNQGKVLREVQSFLGVKQKKLFTLLKKQGNSDQTEIENISILEKIYREFKNNN